MTTASRIFNVHRKTLESSIWRRQKKEAILNGQNLLQISRELSCDVSRAPSYKGFAEIGQQLMLVQTVNSGIQSVVYSYESSFMYINRELSSGDLSFSPSLS
jgi:hypothetical protein